jgi:hypothetical protein
MTNLADIDDMIICAQLWGWPHRTAFLMALQMAASGITARQARWLFYDGLRRVQ